MTSFSPIVRYSEIKGWDTAVLKPPWHFFGYHLVAYALLSSLGDTFQSYRLLVVLVACLQLACEKVLKLEFKHHVKSKSSMLK